MVTGLLRGKLVTLVLGPAGVGMMGLLNHLTMTLTFALVPWLGLRGAGIAFVLGASIYGLIMILFIRRRTGREISAGSLWWCGVAMVTLAVAQCLALRDWSSWFSAVALVVVSMLSGTVYY